MELWVVFGNRNHSCLEKVWFEMSKWPSSKKLHIININHTKLCALTRQICWNKNNAPEVNVSVMLTQYGCFSLPSSILSSLCVSSLSYTLLQMALLWSNCVWHARFTDSFWVKAEHLYHLQVVSSPIMHCDMLTSQHNGWEISHFSKHYGYDQKHLRSTWKNLSVKEHCNVWLSFSESRSRKSCDEEYFNTGWVQTTIWSEHVLYVTIWKVEIDR